MIIGLFERGGCLDKVEASMGHRSPSTSWHTILYARVPRRAASVKTKIALAMAFKRRTKNFRRRGLNCRSISSMTHQSFALYQRLPWDGRSHVIIGVLSEADVSTSLKRLWDTDYRQLRGAPLYMPA